MAAAEIISTARTLLQDEAVPYRYTGSLLSTLLAQAYDRLRDTRPDLFIGRLVSDPALPVGATTDLSHIPPAHRLRMSHEIAANALMIDDDIVGDGGKQAQHHQLAREG